MKIDKLNLYSQVSYYLGDCPFCPNSENHPMEKFHASSNTHPSYYTIICSNCGFEPDFYSSTADRAISIWNTGVKK